jgi:hypothetical protein
MINENELDAIDAAINRGDYGEAAQRIATLDPQDPWTLLCQGQLHEAQQDRTAAEASYRSVLQQAQAPKLTLAARQGLERLRTQRTEERKAAIAQATLDPEKTELGVLVLEAIPAEAKADAAQGMAKIMNLEPYAARMLLPSRGLRFYRSGPIGELEFYGQQLNHQGIPALWHALSELQQVKVYTILYLETLERPVRAVVSSDSTELSTQTIQFDWQEISQRVEGQIPIFEAVVDRDVRGKLLRKEQTQDYVQFCDLHLPKRNCILRLYDSAYQFNQGISLTPDDQTAPALHTSWANWQQLTHLLQQQLPDQPIWSDFDSFAQTALDHSEFLSKLPAHIDLFRREESDWDPAFQLYSALLFLKWQVLK